MKIFPQIEQGSPEWHALRSQYFTASTLGDWLIEEPRLDLTVDQIKAELSARGIEFDKKSLRPALIELLPNDVFTANLRYTERRNDAWESAIEKRLGSISLDEEPDFDTWATKRGKLLEPEARIAYARHQGMEVVCEEMTGQLFARGLQQVGFCAHDSDDFGNSPDSLVTCGWKFSEAMAASGGAAFEIDPSAFCRGVELKSHIARTHLKFLRRGGFREEHAMQVHASMAATGIREWHLFGYHPELPPLFEVFQWDKTTDKVLAGLLRLSEDYWTAYAEIKAMHAASHGKEAA